jgi:hypothetical protein
LHHSGAGPACSSSSLSFDPRWPGTQERPPLAHPLKSGRILLQPVDLSLKELLLGQVEALHNLGVHTLLQHISVVVGDRLEAGMLESVLDNFLSGVVEDQVGRVLVNTVI